MDDAVETIVMRNVLVHDYFGIDTAEVWSTVERDLPPLRAQLAAIAVALGSDG